MTREEIIKKLESVGIDVNNYDAEMLSDFYLAMGERISGYSIQYGTDALLMAFQWFRSGWSYGGRKK